MRSLSVLALLSLCRSAPNTTDMPSHPGPTDLDDAAAGDHAAAAGGAADAATGAEVPAVDLGAEYQAIGFAAGRFALLIDADQRGTHARNWVTERSLSSLVLDLAADGGATACRGWNYMMWNDGPTVHTRDRFREQAGFRGRYQVRGGVVEAELDADPTVCPSIAEYSRGLTPRSTTMKLRCVMARRSGLAVPVLLCEWRAASAPEVALLRVDQASPPPWFVLGRDPGVRIAITGAPPTLFGDPIEVTVEAAPAPIEADAWHTGW